MADDAATMVATARQMLASKGAPMTAENLNRAMLAMNNPTGDVQFDMNAAVERSMQPRATSRTPRGNADPPPRGAAGPGEDGSTPESMQQGTPTHAAGDEPETAPVEENDSYLRSGFNEGNARAQAVAAGNPRGGRRAGTINGATRINEDDPTAGMYAGQPGRQADETGIDQIGLAMALGLPFMIPGMVPGMAARGAAMGAGAARGAAPSAAEFVGNVAPGFTGRMVDAAPTAISGSGNAARIASPAARIGSEVPVAAEAATSAAAPGQAAVANGTARNALPRVDEVLRQRMIERNMAASSRNAARTQAENAAQRGTPRGEIQRGRRETINPVPAGNQPYRMPQSEPIPMGQARRRVSETAGRRRDGEAAY